MRRAVLAMVVMVSLGCSGLTEQMVELGAGGAVDISEDGSMTWEMEDGTIMRTRGGVDVPVPDEMPLPPPWEGAPATSVVTMEYPDGGRGYVVTYEMDRRRQEIEAVYRAWFEAEGIALTEAEESNFMMWSASMKGTTDDGTQLMVSLSDAFGFASVTLMSGRDLERLGKQ